MSIINKIQKAIVRIAITGAIALGVANTDAVATTDADLDALLSQSHTPRWIMNNPFPSKGNPVGIAGNYNNEFALTYSDGTVFRFNENKDAAPTPFAQFSTGLTATAVSYVMPGAGIDGAIAVADRGGFDTYTLTGAHVNGRGLISPYDLQDFKIDLGKVYVATSGDLGIMKSDGTIDEFGTGSSDNILPVNLVSGLTDRIFTASNLEYELDSSGRPILSTYLGTDLTSKQGYGLTENTMLVIRGDGSIRCYDNPFAGNMEVPEPAVSADFNGDGYVNFVDFAIFAAAWLTTPSDAQWNPECDISEPADNIIDTLDLAVFANQWLSGTLP